MKADINLEIFLDSKTTISKKHINLLKAVEKTKSITKAAQVVDISYKSAWDLIDYMNCNSKESLISRVEGVKKNSGSTLSAYAKELVKTYDFLLERQKTYLNTFIEGKNIDELFSENFRRNKVKVSAVNQIKAKITEITEYKFYSDVKFSFGRFTFTDRINAQIMLDLKLEVGKEISFIFKSTNVALSNYQEGSELNNNQTIVKVNELQFSENCVQINLTADEENLISAIISIQDYDNLDAKHDSSLIATIEKEHIFISL